MTGGVFYYAGGRGFTRCSEFIYFYYFISIILMHIFFKLFFWYLLWYTLVFATDSVGLKISQEKCFLLK